MDSPNITNEPISINETSEPATKEITLTPETNDVMQKIFASAKSHLDKVEQHQKILLHDLIDKVVADTQVKATITQGLISMFLDDWERKGEGTLEAGRAGGIFKGGKKPRLDMRPRCDHCHQVWREKPKSNQPVIETTPINNDQSKNQR